MFQDIIPDQISSLLTNDINSPLINEVHFVEFECQQTPYY